MRFALALRPRPRHKVRGIMAAAKPAAASAATRRSSRRRAGRPRTKPPPRLSPLVSHLVRWRQTQGLTQQATAGRLGISVHTLQSYEWGQHEPGGENTLKIIRLTAYQP